MRATRTLLLSTLLGLSGAVAAQVLVPVVAHAQDKTAERLRLEEEMKKLAQRNAWSGVERKYGELMELDIPLPQDDHLLGAQSARYLGKTYEQYLRLERAADIEETEDIRQELDAIDAAYGRVDLKGSERFLPQIVPEVMPFAPDQQKSIEWASTVMSETGSFKGMLPAGKYTVACQEFDVVAGENFLTIPIDKPSKKELAACLGEEAVGELTQGVVGYMGPVALVGYNFMANLAPSDPVMSDVDPGRLQAQAQSVNGSGISVMGGWEVGFNGADQMFGVAAALGYTGMYGGKTADAQRPSTFHGLNAWLAGTLRPGNLRIAAGPTWNLYYGQGAGVACWYELAPGEVWDAGPDDNPENPCLRPSQQEFQPNAIEWRGISMAPGAALSVGYGFLEFGSFLGVVELGGSWATDGERQIINAGIRIGIVPAIDRFEG
jgi:hypothetical protein